jgi:lipopolysaccharide export system permease protein
MKKIDRLVLGELIGPWAFGVAMFSALLIAATYLGKIADYVVQGVPGSSVLEITLLLLPAVLVKTFAMAVLLAALLAFGRLSSDSEIVALRAAGASVYRIVAPVAVFSLLIAGVAFVFNERIVPSAAMRSTAIMNDIANTIKGKALQPTFYPLVEKGKVKGMIVAKDFSLAARTLRGVTVVAYDESEDPSFYMNAAELEWHDESNWRIRGDATILDARGENLINLRGGAWPEYIPQLTVTPGELFASKNNDNDLYSMGQLRKLIREGRETGSLSLEKIRNYEYGYWNKIALPLAAFIFGVLGATLGIRSHRTGTAAGFALAIGIIFAYFTMANFMNVWALGGVFPPYIASFTPIITGLIAAGIILKQRNA